jgi:ribulose bisphosphate carboxylase small subunit
MAGNLEKGGLDDIFKLYINGPEAHSKTPQEVVAGLNQEGQKFEEGSATILEREKKYFKELVEIWTELKTGGKSLERREVEETQRTLENILSDLKNDFFKIASIDPKRGLGLLQEVREIIYRRIVMGKDAKSPVEFRKESAQALFAQLLKEISAKDFYKALIEQSKLAEGKERELVQTFRDALDEAIKKIEDWEIKEDPSWPPK